MGYRKNVRLDVGTIDAIHCYVGVETGSGRETSVAIGCGPYHVRTRFKSRLRGAKFVIGTWMVCARRLAARQARTHPWLCVATGSRALDRGQGEGMAIGAGYGHGSICHAAPPPAS